MERNGPYRMVPGADYPHTGDRDMMSPENKPYPEHPTSDSSGCPNHSTHDRRYQNNSTQQNPDRAYPERSSQDRLDRSYPNNVTHDRQYGDKSPYQDLEMKNLHERNKNRELPEKPKVHQDAKAPEKKKEEDLSWGPRLHSFTQVTTVHGVRHIWEPTPFRIRRIIWVLIVLAGLILFIKQLIACILYYCSYPATVNVRINYNDTIVFPAITICNINSFRTTIAARQGRYDMISHLFSMEDSLDPMSYFTGEEGNITMDELYLDSAHNKHDLIVSCLWDKHKCSADDFEEILMDHGVCYSFNTGRNSSILKVGHTGADRGLRLRLNVEQYEYMTGPNEGAGVKILVHDQEQLPMVRDLGQAVPPGAHAFVGIQILQIHNLKEPYGLCDDDLELEYFDTYSPSSCYVNCKQKFLLEKCGCREFYMPPGLFVGEETRVCMMSEYVLCVKPQLEIFEQEERKALCQCPIPCDRKLFDPIITYAANSNYDMDLVLQNNIEVLEERYHTAREIAQKVNPRIIRKDRLLIKELSAAIRDVDDTFADIDTELSEAVAELENSQAELLTRVAFHRDVALRGVEFSIERDFIQSWNALEERTLNALTSGFYEILTSIDRFIQQQNTPGGDGSGETGKDVLWVIIEAEIANKLDVIQRARSNITKVNRAFMDGTPVERHNFSVDSRYDMALIPKDVLHHNEEKREFYFRQIMSAMDKYVESLNTLREIGNNFASDGKLQKKEYEETKVNFVQVAKNLNYRIFQFKDKIVHRTSDLVQEKISDFVSLNETLKMNSKDLHDLVDSTNLLVKGQKSGHWNHMKKAGSKCHGYMLDFNSSKTELSEYLNSGQMQEDLIQLENFFVILRLRAAEVVNLWVKTEQSYKNVWRSMISEPMTQEFYTLLNNDTKLLISHPDNNTDLLPLFGELLQMDEGTLNSTNVTDFMQMLNADLPDIDLDSKMRELDEQFVKLKKQSNILTYMQDRDKAFLSTIKILQNSLRHFADRNELGLEFYRENFLHLDIFLRELSYEEIIQREAYGLTHLWSDIGGSLAFFLGASVITIFELLDVFLHHTAKIHDRRRKRLKAEKEKEQQNNPQPSVPIKRSRQEMPFDDDPFYHPPFPQHQYNEPEYSEIPRPRHKRSHSRHDRNRPSSRRGPSSKSPNYDAPAAYQLQPERHNRRRRSRSKSPRDYYK